MSAAAWPRPRPSTRRRWRPCSTRRHGVHAAGRGLPRRRRAGVGARRTCSPAAWVCAGRSADLADAGHAPGGAPVGDDAVLLVRGDDGVLRGFFNVCQHRAHELAPCGSTSRAPLDPLPVPRLALRPRRHPAVDAAVRGARRLRPGRPRAASRSPVEEWHGWVMVNAAGDGAAGRRVPRRHRARTSPATSPSASSSAPPTPTSWRPTGS